MSDMESELVECKRCDGSGAIKRVGVLINCPTCRGSGEVYS